MKRVFSLLSVLSLFLLGESCRSAGFSATLPSGLPDVRTWEKSAGWAELDNPRLFVEYELYVHPQRSSVYSVTRYRITPARGPRRRGMEKLQWDEDGRKVHRYECVPDSSRSCRWREFSKGSADYDGELMPILSVYALHSKLLWQRETDRNK